MAGISMEVANVTSISWQDIATATKSNSVLSELVNAIENEFNGEYKLCNEFLRYKDSLYVPARKRGYAK